MKIKYFIAILITFSLSNLFAQNSSGLWLEGGLEKTLIKKKLYLGLDLGGRQKTGEGFNKFILEPSLSYKLTKHFNLFSSYRYTNARTTLENRLSIGASWSDKIIKRTTLGTKVRIQSETSSKTPIWEQVVRAKVSLKHKIKSTKLYPYVNTEIFYSPNPELTGFSDLRIGTGLSIKSFKRQTIKLGYFRALKLLENITSKRNIFTISYNYNLK